MKLLVITQKVDQKDDVMGFFHGWVAHLAPHVEELYVIANGVGAHDLPSHVHLYSLGKESGRSRLFRYALFYWYLVRLLPRVSGVFVHMCPEYVKGLYPLNIFFKRRVVMWYAHVMVSPTAKWAIDHVDRILSPSGHSFLSKTDKFVGTGHGIDTDLFVPPRELPQNAVFQILTLSRITPIKNLEALVEVLNILVSHRGVTNLHVSVAGSPMRSSDEEYWQKLKEQITQYNLESYVSWIGSVENRQTVSLYQKSDLFVRMQPGGGFGKTELEAMACGLPVVLNTPVYNELFPDFAQDIYWEERNIEMFADRIGAVMQWEQGRRIRFLEHARSIVVNHHNLKVLAKRIVDQFESGE